MLNRNKDVEMILKDLVRSYLKGSLTFSLEPRDAELLTWNHQKAFLDATIHKNLLQTFPVKNEFSKLFFKKLIQYIEPYQEVHDDIYSFLCSAMNNVSTDNFCFRHHIIEDDIDNIITIKETNNMVVNGTTGMRTWEAALMLADWAISNKKIFLNKKVLELGAGVGFTGIAIAKYCNVESIVLSDCHTDVLNAIKENIDINFPDIANQERKYQQENIQSYIDALQLDWNDYNEIPNNLLPDIIIGADIVYDPSILQLLCSVLKTFFERNSNLEVYIASMIRNEETFNEFLMILEKNALKFLKVTQECSKSVDWDYKNEQRCLLKILTNK